MRWQDPEITILIKNGMTGRRSFLKKAVLTVPAAALAGTTSAFPGQSGTIESGLLSSEERAFNGWLNVKDCGTSGSTFQTTAGTKSGSRQMTVADVGDFKVGQGVMVSKCNIRYESIRMWSTGIPYITHMREPGNSFEMRGYDGSAGSWMIYILDIAPSSKPAFRWTEDLGRTWHDEVTITHGWQPLSGGVEVKFNQRDWEAGYVVAFGARDQLITRIEKIEGNVLTLQIEANRSVDNAVVRHNDTQALQGAIDRGVKEKLNVFIPVGHYMLAKTIQVNNPRAITIEGASSVDTILDISEGEGTCLNLREGTEVTVRNLRLIGFMGFDERDMAGYINTRGAAFIWGCGLKQCNAMTINNTERVLVENCHASRMSSECFMAYGRSRGTAKSGESYTKWITYRRCSVTNSAFNAFNDVVCGVENTSILNCRVVDVGANAWESASRFVKFIGNYVRNGGPVAMGNLGPANREAPDLTPQNRDIMYPDLGSGQHLVADNVFESFVPYGGCAIRTNRGATQVIIKNNLFINFNSSAVEASASGGYNGYPSDNTIITGNIFDMTCVGQKPISRHAININANDTIISDNQIYVRGSADPLVTGIRLREPALNVNVHDNLIRNCGTGIMAERGVARIGEVIDDKTFVCSNWPMVFPLEINRMDLYKGWSIAWWESGEFKGMSVIEQYDPDTLRFRLREPRQMKAGDVFEFIAPSLQWTMHDNTVTDCLRPVVLDSYGSKTSQFRDNLVTRGATVKVPVGVEVHGYFQLADNRISDFDEQDAGSCNIC